MAGKLFFDCQIWPYPQRGHRAPCDKLAGAVDLFVSPRAYCLGIPQGFQGPCHTSDANVHIGHTGQCGGCFHDHYVSVQIYDLWICAVLYGLFPAAAGGVEGMETAQEEMVLDIHESIL